MSPSSKGPTDNRRAAAKAMADQRADTPRTALTLRDCWWRADYPYSRKVNHRHKDGTISAHDISEWCEELGIEAAAEPAAEPAAAEPPEAVLDRLNERIHAWFSDESIKRDYAFHPSVFFRFIDEERTALRERAAQPPRGTDDD